MTSFRLLGGLITDHDFHGLHLHKILGITCLLHFIYKHFVYPIATLFGKELPHMGSVGWINFWGMYHLFLNLSSFIFPVPVSRYQHKPMIWKEFQLHSLIFTARATIPMILFGRLEERTYYIICAVWVLVMHYCSDLVSGAYRHLDQTTMGNMPYAKGTTKETKQKMRYWYGWCQYVAIWACMTGISYRQAGKCRTCPASTEEHHFSVTYDAFWTLPPIQLAAFLMTLVRKNFITATTWHIVYSGSLALSALFMMNFPPRDLVHSIKDASIEASDVPGLSFTVMCLLTVVFLLRTRGVPKWPIFFSMFAFRLWQIGVLDQEFTAGLADHLETLVGNSFEGVGKVMASEKKYFKRVLYENLAYPQPIVHFRPSH